MARRAFWPGMVMAARTAVVEVDRLVEVGELKPDDIHLPGNLRSESF